eukprot:scaffold12379_cov59-Phaeocystis_antarctica.AAC.5
MASIASTTSRRPSSHPLPERPPSPQDTPPITGRATHHALCRAPCRQARAAYLPNAGAQHVQPVLHPFP